MLCRCPFCLADRCALLKTFKKKKVIEAKLLGNALSLPILPCRQVRLTKNIKKKKRSSKQKSLTMLCRCPFCSSVKPKSALSSPKTLCPAQCVLRHTMASRQVSGQTSLVQRRGRPCVLRRTTASRAEPNRAEPRCHNMVLDGCGWRILY